MKCTINGVMNFSVLDGWWIEGWIEDVTGWAIGPTPSDTDLHSYDESKMPLTFTKNLRKNNPRLLQRQGTLAYYDEKRHCYEWKLLSYSSSCSRILRKGLWSQISWDITIFHRMKEVSST